MYETSPPIVPLQVIVKVDEVVSETEKFLVAVAFSLATTTGVLSKVLLNVTVAVSALAHVPEKVMIPAASVDSADKAAVPFPAVATAMVGADPVTSISDRTLKTSESVLPTVTFDWKVVLLATEPPVNTVSVSALNLESTTHSPSLLTAEGPLNISKTEAPRSFILITLSLTEKSARGAIPTVVPPLLVTTRMVPGFTGLPLGDLTSTTIVAFAVDSIKLEVPSQYVPPETS